MSERVQNNLRRCMALMIAVTGVFPVSAVHGAEPAIVKVAVVPLIDSSDNDSDLEILSARLRNGLRAYGSVLPGDVTDSLIQLREATGSLEGIEGEVTRILSGYYGFKSNAKTAIRDLERVLDALNHQEPSRKSSDVMVSLRMTLAWLKFQLNETEAALGHLQRVFAAVAVEKAGLGAYPASFRRFALDVDKTTRAKSTARIRVESVPAAVPVFVDGITAGVTPLTIVLEEKQYSIGLGTPGRKFEEREIRADSGYSTVMRVRLKWRGTKAKKSKMESSDVFAGVNSAWISQAAAIREATQSDTVVFLGVSRNGGNPVASARVFDGRYRQFLKTVSVNYTDTSDAGEIASALAYKLGRDLKRKEMNYWSHGVDRGMVADHRLATRRGKPIYRQPLFWAAVGVVAAGAITTGILASRSGGGSGPATGGIVVGF